MTPLLLEHVLTLYYFCELTQTNWSTTMKYAIAIAAGLATIAAAAIYVYVSDDAAEPTAEPTVDETPVSTDEPEMAMSDEPTA